MESSTEYWNMPEKGRKSQKRVNLLLLPYIALTVIGKNITKTVKYYGNNYENSMKTVLISALF